MSAAPVVRVTRSRRTGQRIVRVGGVPILRTQCECETCEKFARSVSRKLREALEIAHEATERSRREEFAARVVGFVAIAHAIDRTTGAPRDEPPSLEAQRIAAEHFEIADALALGDRARIDAAILARINPIVVGPPDARRTLDPEPSTTTTPEN